MATVIPSGDRLGATIEGVDTSKPLTAEDMGTILRALARHAVVRFPGQSLEPERQVAFSSAFGTCETSSAGSPFAVPGHPQVMLLSNVVENGRIIGLADAGQDWHTEMSYARTFGYVNVLYAVKVPVRDGKAIGDTLFANMHAAYEGLAPEWKTRLAGMTATHDFNKFWENMIQNHGSARAPLSPEQRAKRPPVVHPV